MNWHLGCIGSFATLSKFQAALIRWMSQNRIVAGGNASCSSIWVFVFWRTAIRFCKNRDEKSSHLPFVLAILTATFCLTLHFVLHTRYQGKKWHSYRDSYFAWSSRSACPSQYPPTTRNVTCPKPRDILRGANNLTLRRARSLARTTQTARALRSTTAGGAASSQPSARRRNTAPMHARS